MLTKKQHITCHLDSNAWVEFSRDWGSELFMAKETLQMLVWLQHKFRQSALNLYMPDEAEIVHVEWVYLLSKLTHPLDTSSFGLWWYNIEIKKFSYNIDLSNPNLPICKYY